MIPHVFEQVLQPIREVASELSDAPGAVLHGARADELPKREGTVPLHGKLGRVDRAMLRDRKFASLRWRETDSNFGFPVRSTLCMRHETRFRSRTCACTLRDLVSRDSQSRCRKSD